MPKQGCKIGLFWNDSTPFPSCPRKLSLQIARMFRDRRAGQRSANKKNPFYPRSSVLIRGKVLEFWRFLDLGNLLNSFSTALYLHLIPE